MKTVKQNIINKRHDKNGRNATVFQFTKHN